MPRATRAQLVSTLWRHREGPAQGLPLSAVCAAAQPQGSLKHGVIAWGHLGGIPGWEMAAVIPVLCCYVKGWEWGKPSISPVFATGTL